jgi:hypothetical protein
MTSPHSEAFCPKCCDNISTGFGLFIAANGEAQRHGYYYYMQVVADCHWTCFPSLIDNAVLTPVSQDIHGLWDSLNRALYYSDTR